MYLLIGHSLYAIKILPQNIRILPVEFSRTSRNRNFYVSKERCDANSTRSICESFISCCKQKEREREEKEREREKFDQLLNKRLIWIAIEILPFSRNRFSTCPCEASLNSIEIGANKDEKWVVTRRVWKRNKKWIPREIVGLIYLFL